MSIHRELYVSTRLYVLVAVVGLLTSAAGFVGGAYLGYVVERSDLGWDCGCDDPGLEGLLYGAALGPVLLTPLSVYLANRRQGNLLVSLVVSAGIAAVAIAGLHVVGGGTWPLFLIPIFAPPVAQAFSAALIAECTSKREHLV